MRGSSGYVISIDAMHASSVAPHTQSYLPAMVAWSDQTMYPSWRQPLVGVEAHRPLISAQLENVDDSLCQVGQPVLGLSSSLPTAPTMSSSFALLSDLCVAQNEQNAVDFAECCQKG